MRKSERIEAVAKQMSAVILDCPALPLPGSYSAVAPTPEQMIAAAATFGLTCKGVFDSPTATARLVGRHIFYNARADVRRQVIYIWHEIIEHLARTREPTLFDDDEPGGYDGAAWPRDVRHEVARAAEAVLIERYPALVPGKHAEWIAEKNAEAEAWFETHPAKPVTDAVQVEGVEYG